MRDVLSHRTGFTRMSPLEIGDLSSEEILRRASSVEAFAPFRQRFYYNNVHNLAAGSAAAAAAGTSWVRSSGRAFSRPSECSIR